jgi:hypothetical protein
LPRGLIFARSRSIALAASLREACSSRPGRVPGLSFSGVSPAFATRALPDFLADWRRATLMRAIRAAEFSRLTRA